MTETGRTAVLGAVLLAGVGSASVARAANESCFDAYEQTQRLRKDGKLVEARDQAAICAVDACPAMIKNDCKRWREEIAKEIPTVVFTAKDDQGQDVAATAVYVDDRKVADAIDGRAIAVNPGPHTVRFESGVRKTEMTVQVAAGDSSRPVAGTFAPLLVAPPAPTSQHRRIPTVSLVLGGVAAVGLVSFVSFAVAGHAEQGCSPVCQPGQISTMRAEYAVADVSSITGLAALGGAFAFWLVQPSAPSDQAPPPEKSGMLRVGASPAPGGATFGVGGSF